jgi:hypothetical protein
MSLASETISDLQSFINTNGESVLIRYYNSTAIAGSYDSASTLTQSGNDLWVSGLRFPITSSRGTTEAFLMEQGRLTSQDSKLYIDGQYSVSGLFTIGMEGSPPARVYAVVEQGVHSYPINGSYVYHKLFISVLPTGSVYTY